jgi:Invasin, domain 3
MSCCTNRSHWWLVIVLACAGGLLAPAASRADTLVLTLWSDPDNIMCANGTATRTINAQVKCDAGPVGALNVKFTTTMGQFGNADVTQTVKTNVQGVAQVTLTAAATSGTATVTGAASMGMLSDSKTISIFMIQMKVLSMDFVNLDDNNPNNFNIRKSDTELLVPGGGPEWKLAADGVTPVQVGPTIYIQGTKLKAKVALQVTPVPTPKSFNVELWTDGAVDFTAEGDDKKTFSLTVGNDGTVTRTFTANTNKAPTKLGFYQSVKFTWKGCANQAVTQQIYVLAGKPLDRFPKGRTAPESEPLSTHLQMLLGPTISLSKFKGGVDQGKQDKGEWINNTSDLAADGATSIQAAVRTGLVKDGSFDVNIQGTADPWDVVLGKGSICESFAQLMVESLLVAGIPESSTQRKSVVALPVIVRPTWLGQPGPMKLINAFVEPPGGGPSWINEGVVGVLTSNKGWRYYDVAGTITIGTGGWDTPNDPGGMGVDQNLWYVGQTGTAPKDGPVIKNVTAELYGTWERPAADINGIKPNNPGGNPWDAGCSKNSFPRLVSVTQRGYSDVGKTKMRIWYRTEGVKNVGTQVEIKMFRWDGVSAWVNVGSNKKAIANMWDNSDEIDIPFGAVPNTGLFRFEARILDATNTLKFSGSWEDTDPNFNPLFLKVEMK